MARVDFPSRTIFLNIRELSNHISNSIKDSMLEYSPFILNSLKLGQKWHQIIQHQYLDFSENNSSLFCGTELFISCKMSKFEGWNIILRGRLDILTVNKESSEIRIIEIKTTRKNFSDISPEIDQSFKFQVLSYCWLFNRISRSRQASMLSEINIAKSDFPLITNNNIKPQIIIVNTLSGNKDLINPSYEDGEFTNTLNNVRNNLLHFLLHRINHVEKFRLVKNIPWFFEEFRRGQQENLTKVRDAMNKNPITMQIGPPGTGKTAINFRILLERSISEDKQIYYSSTKTSQQLEVVNIVKRLNVQLKTPIWTVILLAKEKYCINPEMEVCDPFKCNYFLAMKANPINYVDIFNPDPIASVDRLKDLALTSGSFCPYYKSKFLAGFADLVIGDQNFIFSPETKVGILLRSNHPLLFSKKGLPYLYLLDEAHNLPSRVRDELSLSLDLNSLILIKKNSLDLLSLIDKNRINFLSSLLDEVITFLSSLSKFSISNLNEAISAFDLLQNSDNDKTQKSIDFVELKSDEGEFFTLNIENKDILKFKELIDQFYALIFILEDNFDSSDNIDPKIVRYLIELQELAHYFLKLLDSMYENQEGNIQFFYHKFQSRLKLETYVLNISKYISQELKGTQGTVIMSATLFPEFFYRVIFNFSPEVSYIQLTNHFPEKNRKTLIINDIQTRYADINKIETINKICVTITSVYESKKGKYLVFTPNLKLIDQIYSNLKIKNKFTQNQDINFNDLHSGVIICSLGSVYSEGVNIPNLSGVIIISPGIPPPSYKNSLLMEYYKIKTKNHSIEDSFSLVFKIPGLNKILQSAGRLHRKPEDKGIIFLLGERFGTKEYVSLFPPFLHPMKTINCSKIKEEVLEFWENK